MVRHCSKCRRKWIVSALDKQEHYICPECAEKERERLARQGLEDAKRFMKMLKEESHENRRAL